MIGRQRQFNKTALLIGGSIFVLGLAISWVIPEITNQRPFTVYWWGNAALFSAFVQTVGLGIILVSVIRTYLRKPKSQQSCPECGSAVRTSDDLFCRVCGAALVKTSSQRKVS